MLVSVLASVAVASLVTLEMAMRAEMVLRWIGYRLVVGELLVAVLAAAHVVTTLKRARGSREWEEWRLIPEAPRELARALMKSTHQMIWVGLAVWAAVELGYIIWISLAGRGYPFTLVVLGLLFIIHATSAKIAAACFLTEAARSPGSVLVAWCNGFIQFIFEAFVQFTIVFLLSLLLVAFLRWDAADDILWGGALIILVVLAYIRNLIIRGETRIAEKALEKALQAD
jgi:hypothetical protein